MEQLNLNSKIGVFSAQNITKYWKNQQITLNSSTFTDPYFPPNDHSIYSQNENGEYLDKVDGEFQANKLNFQQYEWKRASEIFGGRNNILLFEDKIDPNDIKQGVVGDCYFLSALAALSEFPNLIYQIFRTKEINPQGFYEIVLFIDGEWQIVYVDDLFPVFKDTNLIAFAGSNGNELWVLLLEKAWAKVNGGYSNIAGGWATEVFLTFTGYASKMLPHFEYSIDDLWTVLKSADEANKIMCSSSKSNEIVGNGIVKGHVYSLIGTKSKLHEGQELRLIKLRNPWGYSEWKGDWSDNSSLWTQELKEYFQVESKEDGIFYMNLNDFTLMFDLTHLCHNMYYSNVKSYRVNSDSINVPHIFNLKITEPVQVSISIVTKHWRFNRELTDKMCHLSLFIAKYNQEKKAFSQVVGEYSSYGDVFHVNTLLEGTYTIWVYCNYNSCDEPKPEFYSVIFSSPTKYLVNQSTDTNCKLIKEMIIGELKTKNSERINSEDIVVLTGNPFPNTQLFYYAVFNQSENYYKISENDEDCMNDMILLPTSDTKEKFHQIVPPKSYGICLTLKKAYWSGCLNLNTSILLDNSQIIHTPRINLEKNFSIDSFSDNFNNAENYYEYITSSLEECKRVIEFKKFNRNGPSLDDLIETYPVFMKMLLELPGEDNENYYWAKIDFYGDYYIGQLKKDTKIYHGRGIYCYNSSDKSYYIGYFDDGRKHGIGRLCNSDSSLIYEGKYFKGDKHGNGKLFLSNGMTYDGSFENDDFNGFGIFTYQDGSRWEGTFSNGAKVKGMFFPINGDPYEL